MTNKDSQQKNHHSIRLDIVTEKVLERIRDILDWFDVDYNDFGNRIAFPCPIHESSKPNSLSLLIDGEMAGIWKCWTKSCQDHLVEDIKDGQKVERPLGKGIFGLIRGLLSAKYGRHFEYSEAISWCKGFLGNDLPQIDDKEVDDYTFVKQAKVFNKKNIQVAEQRPLLLSEVKIPAEYFLSRGFKESTLKRYEVGLCKQSGSIMYNRAVIPIYNLEYKSIVGYLGRTVDPMCPACRNYHDFRNPCSSGFPKWLNSEGFPAANILYNSWFAKDEISKTGKAILVEGSGDVWKLEESGIHIGLGLFGLNMSGEHIRILNKLGVMNLYIITDNDEAGNLGANRIINKCKDYFNCTKVNLPSKDLGQMDTDSIKNILKTIL